MRFSRYGSALDYYTLEELTMLQKQDGLLFAHAELSGSEGCYCEVAIWNDRNRRFEKLCFYKFFSNEHPVLPSASAEAAAKYYAEMINSLSAQGELSPIVNRMPHFHGPAPVIQPHPKETAVAS